MSGLFISSAGTAVSSFIYRQFHAAATTDTRPVYLLFDEWGIGPLEKLDWQVEQVCRLAR